jgi:hypothetical protein
MSIHLIWIGDEPHDLVADQIVRCVASALFHQPATEVVLHTDCFSDVDLPGATLARIDGTTVWSGTPLSGRDRDLGLALSRPADCRLWSDALRVSLLWRFGGTYIDVDDVFVRSIGDELRNCLPAAVVGSDEADNGHIRFRGEKLPLIDSNYCRSGTGAFRFGNDPLIGFDSGNRFLWHWMKGITCDPTNPRRWGQAIPTRLFASRAHQFCDYIEPIPWHDLLYHNYKKGHPPSDKRYAGPHIQCWDVDFDGTKAAAVFEAYRFLAVKNKQKDKWMAGENTVAGRLVSNTQTEE